MKPNLHIVDDEATAEDELRSLLRSLERIEREKAKVEREAREKGRAYINSTRPNEREFLLPTLERLRRDLGL